MFISLLLLPPPSSSFLSLPSSSYAHADSSRRSSSSQDTVLERHHHHHHYHYAHQQKAPPPPFHALINLLVFYLHRGFYRDNRRVPFAPSISLSLIYIFDGGVSQDRALFILYRFVFLCVYTPDASSPLLLLCFSVSSLFVLSPPPFSLCARHHQHLLHPPSCPL
jgi:hypothetical protein